MILTHCPACAAPLPAMAAKQCGRCKTRYCGPACQKQHWEQGHDKLCKQIKKGGGAEQYHADQKYKDTVVAAVEGCAEDTKGQTCYICTEAVHRRTKEGLVRMCACRGTSGFVHVSCLVEQAKVLNGEAEENNLSGPNHLYRWERWHTCGLCEQKHHGIVYCALGWACWKTYLGRSEDDRCRRCAMTVLGNGLLFTKRAKDALRVFLSLKSLYQRRGAPMEAILTVNVNMANCYWALGCLDEALQLRRQDYEIRLKVLGAAHADALGSAQSLAHSLVEKGDCAEARTFLTKQIPIARRVLGPNAQTTLTLCTLKAQALCSGEVSVANAVDAIAICEDTSQRAQQILGATHPTTKAFQEDLRLSRECLAKVRATPEGRANFEIVYKRPCQPK